MKPNYNCWKSKNKLDNEATFFKEKLKRIVFFSNDTIKTLNHNKLGENIWKRAIIGWLN